MAEEATDYNFNPLIEMFRRLDPKEVATEVHRAFQVIDGGKGGKLRPIAQIIQRQIGRAGHDVTFKRIEDYYRTADWVAQHNDGEVLWAKNRTFSEHERARVRDTWTWKVLLAKRPPYNEQGLEGSKTTKSLIKTGISSLFHGDEYVRVDVNHTSGMRKRQLMTIEAAIDEIRPNLEDIYDKADNL